MKALACLLAVALLALPAQSLWARGGGAGGSHSSGSHSSGSHGSSGHAPRAGSSVKSGKSDKCLECKRDSKGRIARSEKAKDAFKKEHPCPSTGKSSGACPGYVIDHVKPLKRGGADDPSNMQWQTTAEAKAKDKTE